MSIKKFVDGLDKSQLLHAKECIEERLSQYANAEKVKFASLVYGSCRHAWCDVRDAKGWEILKQKYEEQAKERFDIAIDWCKDSWKTLDFNEEIPTIEFVTVSVMDYQGWLKDSVNPSFVVVDPKEETPS